MISPTTGSVLAVVVAYFPEPQRFSSLLQQLLAQTGSVLVVDNTPALEKDAERVAVAMPEYGERLRIVRCGENSGIGVALNIGIEAAIQEGYEHVLLSDQDSLPAHDMVQQLLHISTLLSAAKFDVGAVSPAYLDEVTGDWFRFQVKRPGQLLYSSVDASTADPWLEVLTSITSGTLIPIAAINQVGLMREDYFIDDIDVEWCLRAKFKGFRLFGTANAVMHHRLGEATFRVWCFGWRYFNGYHPSRLYYRFRNFILLCREDHAPLGWKIRAGSYWLGQLYGYLLFSPNRRANSRYISRGFYDAFRRRVGKLDGGSA